MNVTAFYPSDDFVKVDFDNDTSKTISWEDFIEGFLNAYKPRATGEDKLEVTQTLKLPPNTFIQQYSNKGKDLTISMYYDEAVHALKYARDTGNKGIRRHVPNMVITCKFQLNDKTKMWALRDARFLCTYLRFEELGEVTRPVSTATKGFTALPLPNMYSDGKMCYGSNSIPSSFPKNDISGISWLYTMTVESIFNNDLSIPGIRHEIAQWMNEIKEKKHECFPYWEVSGMEGPTSSKKEYLAHRKAMQATFG